MQIKDERVLNGIAWAAADNMYSNTIGAFQTSYSYTPGNYIVHWIGNAYNLHEKYKCHAFNTSVIITEGELVFPDKFMTPMRNASYWYYNPDEAIPVMVNLKQVVIPYIELIQDNNTKNELP